MGTVTAGTHIEVDAVAHGRPATEAVAARIAAGKVGHPLDAVTVIVPSNQAGLSVRRLLGSGALGASGLANVAFVTPFRLAELLGSTELGDRRPLTNPVLAAAARAVLATEPGMFREVAGHQATSAAVVELYAELSRALPATLAAIAAGSARGADVVRLVRAVQARLDGYHDEDDLARAAVGRLGRDAATVRGLGAVVWYLPERLSPSMHELVRLVLTRASSAAIVAGLSGAHDADELVHRLCAGAGAPVPEPPAVEEPRAERILSVSDPDEEVRTVLREVMALAADGTDLDRIGIFFPSAEPYARTLLEQLRAAGIPHNGPATARLADSVAGRTLLGALGLRTTGWGRSDVVALLSAGPVRHDGRLAPSGRWDELSRVAGVVGGRHDWSEKLTAHAALLRSRRAELDPSGGEERRRGRLEADASAAEDLAVFVEGLAHQLEDLDAAPSWAARSDAARSLLVALLGPEHLRTGWPDHELDAASRVDAALARLVVLDEVEPDPGPVAFELAVQAELEARVGRIGRFGEGVLVAPLAAAVGLDLDAVFVVGMVEGTCPSFRREDALLPDIDRSLAASDELLTRQERLGDLHRSYLSALAAAPARRTLLFPRGDLRDRRHRLASRWLLDSLGARLGRKVFSSDVAELAPHELEVVASYADGISRATVHGSLTDRDVGALLHHVGLHGDPAAHPLARGTLGRGFRCNRSRRSADFTEWDGNLAGQALPSPAAGHPISSSRLETWATCPFRYFMAHVLRLDDRDDPEEITEIGATDVGSLVHEVLERFLREVLDRPGGGPAPAQRWTAVDRARVEEIAAEIFQQYEQRGLTGRPLLWRRRQAEILDDLQAFLDHDDGYRAANGARPVRAEMPFGLEGAPPLTLDLEDGRTLSFRGRADRVDEAGARLVVLDYKTGKNRYAALADDPVLAGTTLQLGIYAEAAMAELGAGEVEARYWMTSTQEKFAQPGYLWTEDHRSRFLEVVGAIVDGIESGTFPGQPGPFDSYFGKHENCGFCAFDRVCPRDRDDHQEAKADAPELSLLARLALPEAGERGA